MASEVKRTEAVKARLTVDISERLKRLALAQGLPVSVVLAVAAGEYVVRQERQLHMVDALTGVVGKTLGDAFRDELANVDLENIGKQLSLGMKRPKENKR